MNVPSVVGWWVARGGAAEAGARGPLQGAGNSSFPAWASLPYLLGAGYQLPATPSLPAAAACNPKLGWGRVQTMNISATVCGACFGVSVESFRAGKKLELGSFLRMSLGRARLHCPPAAAAPGCCCRSTGETAALERDAGISLQKMIILICTRKYLCHPLIQIVTNKYNPPEKLRIEREIPTIPAKNSISTHISTYMCLMRRCQ